MNPVCQAHQAITFPRRRRDRRENQVPQAWKVCQDRKAFLGCLETLGPPGRMGDLVCQDLQVRKVTLGYQVSQEPQVYQGRRATWERWDSQDPAE